jgi:hypothetical protein
MPSRDQNIGLPIFIANGWNPDLSDEEIVEKLLALNLERANGWIWEF